MEKVLITGANGFLGANLTRELFRLGFDIKIFIRPSADVKGIADIPCEIYYGYIDRPQDVQEAVKGCHIVIHAACITGQWGISFAEYERANFTATKYITEACLLHQVKKFIYVSTANTIGPGNKNNPGNELNGFTLFNVNSGYINSKYLAQQYVLEQVTARQLPAIVVNPTFMIGPHDTKPSSGKLILYGLKHRLLFYPPGGKNFVHIKDVCHGIINAMEKGKTGDCYLLAGHNLSYAEFFRLLRKVSGKKQLLIRIPAFLLKAAGILSSMTRLPWKLNYTTAYLLCLDNYYSGKKSERELQLRYTPVEAAVTGAFNWFKENNYI